MPRALLVCLGVLAMMLLVVGDVGAQASAKRKGKGRAKAADSQAESAGTDSGSVSPRVSDPFPQPTYSPPPSSRKGGGHKGTDKKVKLTWGRRSHKKPIPCEPPAPAAPLKVRSGFKFPF